ncbi:MAG: hypothetical protein ACR2HZ_04795 [Gemmatimonadaceae bacterium]
MRARPTISDPGWRTDGKHCFSHNLTDRSRAVVVPNDLGYTLVLSPGDPEGLVAALRN